MPNQRDFSSDLIQRVTQIDRCIDDYVFRVTIACELDLTALSRAIFKCRIISDDPDWFWGALLPALRERIVRHPQHPSCLAAKAPFFPVTRRYRCKPPFPPHLPSVGLERNRTCDQHCASWK